MEWWKRRSHPLLLDKPAFAPELAPFVARLSPDRCAESAREHRASPRTAMFQPSDRLLDLLMEALLGMARVHSHLDTM